MTRLGTALSFVSLSLTTEVMTRLDTVLFFVSWSPIWDRLYSKLFAARDRDTGKLTVKQSSISWRLRRQGVDEVMTRLGTVLFFAPLGSTWDRLNSKLVTARDRNNFKLIVEKGSIVWQLRRHGVDEVIARLNTVLSLVSLSSTWDRLNSKLFAARDRNNCKLTVKQSSISWRLRRQGVDDEAMARLGTVLFFVPLSSTWD